MAVHVHTSSLHWSGGRIVANDVMPAAPACSSLLVYNSQRNTSVQSRL